MLRHRFPVSRRFLGAGTVALVCAAGATIPARADAGGDNNRGTIKVQDSAAPTTDANDPKLSCGTVYILGDDLADPSGALTIDSIPPSGSGMPVAGYTDLHYTYNLGTGGEQVLVTFSGQALVNAAAAQGATTGGNGYHFKVDLAQGEASTFENGKSSNDEQKHKTFFLSCTPAGAVGTVTATPTPAPRSTPTPSPAPSVAPTQATAVLGLSSTPRLVPSASNTSPQIAGRVEAASVSTPNTGFPVPAPVAGLLLLIGFSFLAAQPVLAPERLKGKAPSRR